MDQEIIKLLEGKRPGSVHQALLEHVECRLKQSRSDMQQQYPAWDQRHEMYRKRRGVDANDQESLAQGLPNKIIVPLGYSHINTFVAFGFMLYTQRERFYEFCAIEDGDWPMRECVEKMIQRDMVRSEYKKLLVQNLLNVGRFGLSCEVESFERDNVWIPVEEVGETPSLNGVPIAEATVTKKLTKVTRSESNCVESVSPYRIFPDTSKPLADWRKGEFFAWDCEYSRAALEQMEREGMVTGVEHVENYQYGNLADLSRTRSRFAGIDMKNLGKEGSSVVVTKMVIRLAPAAIKGRDGKKLGDEENTHLWLIWVANDSRIIRAEPQTNLHAEFPASLSMFDADTHDATVSSLAAIVDDLQRLVSWLMNSRMAAVSRTIDNQIVVDPLGLNMNDVNQRKRVIQLTKFGAGKDTRRFITQLPIHDSTTGHVADMANITNLMQMVSGVNDNAMGQYNGGRRSATEARTVMNGAASRLKMVFDVNWGMHYQPQANRLLINSRQETSPEEFVRVVGQANAQHFPQYRADPITLAQGFDYVTYDGTLPGEKLFMAQQLQELLGLLLMNPASSAAFNMDPVKVQKEIMQLRGLGTGSNFAFEQVPEALISLLQSQTPGANNTPTV